MNDTNYLISSQHLVQNYYIVLILTCVIQTYFWAKLNWRSSDIIIHMSNPNSKSSDILSDGPVKDILRPDCVENYNSAEGTFSTLLLLQWKISSCVFAVLTVSPTQVQCCHWQKICILSLCALFSCCRCLCSSAPLCCDLVLKSQSRRVAKMNKWYGVPKNEYGTISMCKMDVFQVNWFQVEFK
jgi:hypothetical protein